MAHGVAFTSNTQRAIVDERALARAQKHHLTEMGIASFFRRGEEINQLPKVAWKGRSLFTLHCNADFGKGPHDYNVPEFICWILLSLTSFRCAWHAN